MNSQLSRLQAFLADAGELVVVAPPAAIRPDYFTRCARMLGAALVASHVATAAAAPVPAESSARPAHTAEAQPVIAPAGDTLETRMGIASVKLLAARYLAHGRSPLKPHIMMLSPKELPEEGPSATSAAGEVCKIEGVRSDYSHADPLLAVMADTPQMRALVLIHESMHCRLGPALLRHIAHFPSPLAAGFAVTFSESSADAMSILTLARRDGVPLALRALDRLYAIRAAEAVTPEADGHHDSRETLKRIRTLLERAPEKISSDGAAFSLAITETLIGAAVTFKNSLPADQKGYVGTREFRSDMAGLHQAIEEMGRDYLDGPHELGSPQITLNKMTHTPPPAAAPAEWQMLAKRGAAPPFTAAGLRGQAEAITDSLIAAAGSSRVASVASTAAPSQPPMGPQALGRLRTRVATVYDVALRGSLPSEIVPGDHPAADAPRTGM